MFELFAQIMGKVGFMVVMKFGGAVLNSIEGFNNMLRIIKSNESKRILLVISAFSKSTRNLKSAAITAETGDLTAAMKIADELYREYYNFAKMLIDKNSILDILVEEYKNSFSQLYDFLKGISITRELTYRTLDAVMSFGERLSLLTAHYYLSENGVALASIDSSEILKTDDNYGFANPNLELCEKNINELVSPLIEQSKIVITQGFVASTISGEITTMGIESSNLSAALYAKYLKAEEFIIYTDVQGIRTADPKLFSDTKCIKQLSYDQAYLAGVSGVKLIFPEMVEIVRSANLKVIIKSAFADDGEFTTVKSERGNSAEIITIAKEGLFMIREKFTSSRQAAMMNDSYSRGQFAANEYFSISKSECIVISSENNSFYNFTDNAIISNSLKMLTLINLSGADIEAFRAEVNKETVGKKIELMLTQMDICKIFYLD